MKPTKIAVTCPRCGHAQQEPPAAYSTRCRKCGEHFRLEDVVRPAPARGADTSLRPAPKPAGRRVACFQCGTLLDVPPSAQSTMCKRCSSHVDLRDYDITRTESKNFRTRGRFVIHEGGCLLNTDTTVQDAVLKGRVIGKLNAEGVLEIHRTAEIKGSFKAGTLVIPEDTVFRWPTPITVHGTDISGELQGNLVASGTVILRRTARFFGDIDAAAMQVESGAVVVGHIRLGPRPAAAAANATANTTTSAAAVTNAAPAVPVNPPAATPAAAPSPSPSRSVERPVSRPAPPSEPDAVPPLDRPAARQGRLFDLPAGQPASRLH